MIVKPRLVERARTHDDIERRIVGALALSLRGWRVMRALSMGVAAAPLLLAGLAALLAGNAAMGVPMIGVGLCVIWIVKRRISRALRTG